MLRIELCTLLGCNGSKGSAFTNQGYGCGSAGFERAETQHAREERSSLVTYSSAIVTKASLGLVLVPQSRAHAFHCDVEIEVHTFGMPLNHPHEVLITRRAACKNQLSLSPVSLIWCDCPIHWHSLWGYTRPDYVNDKEYGGFQNHGP